MKKLLIIFFVTCFCKQIVFANDIEDLKIEGISVGDRALDFFTEDEIKSRSKSYPGNKRFTPVYNDKLILKHTMLLILNTRVTIVNTLLFSFRGD